MPKAASSAGPEAVELAASAGLFLDEWQQAAVIDLLGEDRDGNWAATTGGLIAPRQNGKGCVIEALELAWLFLCDVELIFHSAHLFATAADAYRRIKTLIQDTPDLDRQVAKYSEQHGQEGIELHSGQRLRFVARSKSGGRGFPAPVVVLDEAFNLSAPMMAALVPTMAAQDNPFLLVTSSAPIDDPCSDVLRNLMRRSRAGDVERRCYIEYCADPAADFDTQLAQANPGRLNDDVVTEEQELLTPEAFRIERLGIVDLSDETAKWRVIPQTEWLTCQDLEARPASPVRYAIDSDINARGETWVSIGRSDGLVVEDVTPSLATPGTGWVVPALLAKKDIVGELVIDPYGPAGQLVAPLEKAGFALRKVTGQEVAQASQQILEAIITGGLRHVGQARLSVAAAGANRKDMGDGAWRFSRTASTCDISPLMAAMFARWAALAAIAPVEADFFTI